MQIFRLVILTLGAGLAVAGCGSGDTGESTTSMSAASSSSAHSSVQSSAPATAQPTAQCGVDLTAPVIGTAIATLPMEPMTKVPWSTAPASFEGNFDPCVTLSTVIISIQGATGSSPDQALLFHRGEFVGTATEDSHGFTALDPAHTTDDTVGLIYKMPGSCNACPDGTLTPVQFHWDGKRVQMIGTPPK